MIPCTGPFLHRLPTLAPSARQYLSYGDFLQVKREYYRNSFVLDCVTEFSGHSPLHTYISSSYRFNKLGLSHWDPYTVRGGGCLELYCCNMVEWFLWDSSLIFDDQLVSFSALTLLVWSSGPEKLSPKWRILCRVGRWTLHTHTSNLGPLWGVIHFAPFNVQLEWRFWSLYSQETSLTYMYSCY